jgi:hypothetical protein
MRFLCLLVLLGGAFPPLLSQEDEANRAGSAPAPPQKPSGDKESAEAPGLPRGVLARVNGKYVTVEDYTRYLFVHFGRSKLDELLQRILIEEEAGRLGIEITPDDVEKEVEGRVESTARAVFNGDRARMEADLRRRGLTLAEHRESLRQTVAYDLLADACIVKAREIGEDEIRSRFERLYGEGGVRHELRHILVAVPAPDARVPAGAPPSRDAARKEAEGILDRLEAGADFVELVRARSDDALSRQNDGRIPVYRPGIFGEEFDGAVAALSEEKPTSGVVSSPRGFHIISLIRREVTPLEAKRAEIEEYLRTRRPDDGERQDFVRKLLERATIER